uniref:NADH dehydrogenase subunit 6 n=1 Tax=Chlorogomphus shanicus TaxID=2077256 RepID=UPI0023AAF252|nr:NADH dehydrogenase subunit 6 [Chlorogomphus shanicus]WCO11402.1 NADH dehydrogenase subunit 6 [Chlorogomphus shanicus]
MSQIIFLIIASMNSMIFLKMTHPMSMGISLLMQTILMCMVTGYMSQTAWFSYILFLVFVGGMLVLFIYMTSIASNEIFQKNNYLLMLTVTMIVLSFITLIMFSDPILASSHNTNEIMPMMEMFKSNEKLMMMGLYNNPNATITAFMVIYLLLTLIVIVFITKSHRGPLRPSN